MYKKWKVEPQVSGYSKKKKVVEEFKYDSDSDTMDKIENYEGSSAKATDEVESSEEKSGDKSTSGDNRDTGDEDDDPYPCQLVQEKSLVALIISLHLWIC